MDIKPIKNERDYAQALRRVESLWKSPQGSPESDELDVLATLLEAYERDHYPMDLPDPVEAIKFRLEQEGKDSRALIGVIGQRTRVYEVLRGKRSLSLNMIRQLHDKFGIPANVLIQPGSKTRKPVAQRAARRLRSTTLKKSA
jgi:HTH-type transcriptional regulator/antitoxin HigA